MCGIHHAASLVKLGLTMCDGAQEKQTQACRSVKTFAQLAPDSDVSPGRCRKYSRYFECRPSRRHDFTMRAASKNEDGWPLFTP